MNREGDICLKNFPTTHLTSDYSSAICGQFGGSLISLDSDQKIEFLRAFVLQNRESQE